jgi:hypothetical protein
MSNSAALSLQPDRRSEGFAVSGLSPQQIIGEGSSASTAQSIGRLRSHACDEIRKWNRSKARRRSSLLQERWRDASESIQKILRQPSVSPRESVEVSPELVWLVENARLMRTALNDTRQTIKHVRRLPQIDGSSGEQTPRAYAIAKSYLQAVDFEFAKDSLSIYLADGLRPGALRRVALCRSGVRTKLGINMVRPGEPGGPRLSHE